MTNFLIALWVCTFQLIPPWHYVIASSQQPALSKTQTISSQPHNKQVWRAGVYLGLTIGKSTRLDVLRMLGEPKQLERPSDQLVADENPEAWYVYDSTGKFAGDLIVVIDERTDIVLRIDLNPHNLTKEDAVKHFGSDFIVTRYAFDDCLGNEESAPLFESASGPVLEVEYRQRGIALSLTEDGKVDTISYVSKPIGSLKSRCKSSTARLPRH
jgi:hypothetical protein